MGRRQMELTPGSVHWARPDTTVGREQAHRLADEGGMVPLDIKGCFQPFGIGKCRWVEKDQLVAVPRPNQPLPAVGLNPLMLGTVDTVQFQIAPCPVQIGRRPVYCSGAGGSAQRGVNCGGAGVAEQVEEAPPAG